MKKIECQLLLASGRTVTVNAAARYRDEEVPIVYLGDERQLEPCLRTATLGFLEWYLAARALHFHGRLNVKTEGEFEPEAGEEHVEPVAAAERGTLAGRVRGTDVG
jgi:hypothetical protein